MKLVVIHNAEGDVLLLGRLAQPKPKQPKFDLGFNPEPGQYVLELEATGDLAEKPVDQIHRECRVDVKAKKLVRRKA